MIDVFHYTMLGLGSISIIGCIYILITKSIKNFSKGELYGKGNHL